MRIPEDIRSDIRFTAFFLGNGTLIPHSTDIEEYDLDYRELLQQQPQLIEQVLNVHLNVLREWTEEDSSTPSNRAAQWMLFTYNSKYQPIPPFSAWEQEELGELSVIQDYFDAVKRFAKYIAVGFPEEFHLQYCDYEEYLFDGGSFIESFFAVFCNVLQIDTNNRPLNTNAALHRAVQFIRHTVDCSYLPQPPFADWEVELI